MHKLILFNLFELRSNYISSDNNNLNQIGSVFQCFLNPIAKILQFHWVPNPPIPLIWWPCSKVPRSKLAARENTAKIWRSVIQECIFIHRNIFCAFWWNQSFSVSKKTNNTIFDALHSWIQRISYEMKGIQYYKVSLLKAL